MPVPGCIRLGFADDEWRHGDMKQPIGGYHQDEEGHWVAKLACGHNQHVRHDPPWTNRPWVITHEGRDAHIGTLLDCKKCDRGEPPDRPGFKQRAR